MTSSARVNTTNVYPLPSPTSEGLQNTAILGVHGGVIEQEQHRVHQIVQGLRVAEGGGRQQSVEAVVANAGGAEVVEAQVVGGHVGAVDHLKGDRDRRWKLCQEGRWGVRSAFT